MKNKLILLFFLFSFSQLFSQEMSKYTGTVEKVEGVPIFMFSIPVEKHHEVGTAASTGYIIKMGANEIKSIDNKTRDMVKSALKKKESGKLGEFDAILLDMIKVKIKAIKFDSVKSDKAVIQEVEGTPVFFYSKPDNNYTVISDIPANFSIVASRGMLFDKVLNIVRKTHKKLENGEIKDYDAIIFNPKDLTSKAVKFKD